MTSQNLEAGMGVLPAGHPVVTFRDLCLALRGDETSFTGDLLRLIAKADPGNRHQLRLAFPRQVAAWEAWHTADPPVMAEALAEIVSRAVMDRWLIGPAEPQTASREDDVSCPLCGAALSRDGSCSRSCAGVGDG
jgi:hypothetical protein